MLTFVFKTFCFGLMIILWSICLAFPPLEPYQQGAYVFNVPVGWTVQLDEAQGLIYLQENPDNPVGADILLLSTINQNNFSAEQLLEQAILSTGLSDYTILSQDYVANGFLVTIDGFMDSAAVRVALFSSVDFVNNTFLLASFAATPERFEALGGANLLFVTVGGQDPSYFEASTQLPSGVSNADAGCFIQGDVVYTADYCVYLRAMSNPLAVTPDMLVGEWTYAVSIPTGDVWEQGGELSFDSSGSGLAFYFHSDGSYDLLYSWSSSYNFCVSSAKAFEEGGYQFDGRSLQLVDASFSAELVNCGSEPTIWQEAIPGESLELAFISEHELAVVLSCEIHPFMIDCNDNKTRYFVMQRVIR